MIAASPPQHRNVVMDNQLSTLFVCAFLQSYNDYFVRMLSVIDTATIFSVFPACSLAMTRFNMQKILNIFANRKWPRCRSLAIREGAEMSVGEFLNLWHWLVHTSNSRLPPHLVDGYDCFPMLARGPRDKSEKALAACFLKPSSPFPFQTALALATSKGAIRLFVLGKFTFYPVSEINLGTRRIRAMASSPKGSCLAALDHKDVLWLCLLSRSKIDWIETHIRTKPKRIREDMFQSENHFMTADPANFEGWNCTVRDVWSHSIDRAGKKIVSSLFASKISVSATMAVLKMEKKQVTVQLRHCNNKTHSRCGLSMSESSSSGGEGRREERRGFSVCVYEAAVGDWVFSPDRKRLYLAVQTALESDVFMKMSFPLIPVCTEPLCFSCFDRHLNKLGILYLDLERPLEGNKLRPLFHRENRGEREIPVSLSNPWANYLQMALPAAESCLLRCGDRALVAKMGSSAARIFWLKMKNGGVELTYMVGGDKEMFDLSIDSNYLIAFSTQTRLEQLKVGKFCPTTERFTIEEATRSRASLAALRAVKTEVHAVARRIKVRDSKMIIPGSLFSEFYLRRIPRTPRPSSRERLTCRFQQSYNFSRESKSSLTLG